MVYPGSPAGGGRNVTSGRSKWLLWLMGSCIALLLLALALSRRPSVMGAPMTSTSVRKLGLSGQASPAAAEATGPANGVPVVCKQEAAAADGSIEEGDTVAKALATAREWLASKHSDRPHRSHMPELGYEAHLHLAKLQQEVFCLEARSMVLPEARQVWLKNQQYPLTMTLYRSSDAVSQALLAGNQWESHELNEVLWALAAPLPPQSLSTSDIAPALFVDVGANVGAFMLSAAARGYEVIGFEGMHTNQQLIRSSLCANGPSFAARATLFGYGLGAQRSRCFLFSDMTNKGDGIAMCDAANASDASSKVQKGYALRGHMNIERLDSVLMRDIKCMKIDVEGFEPLVLAGAEKLLQQHNVWFLVAEFNPVLLRHGLKGTGEEPTAFVWRMRKLGYKVSESSFRGPFLADAAINGLGADNINRNLYFVHHKFKDLAAPL